MIPNSKLQKIVGQLITVWGSGSLAMVSQVGLGALTSGQAMPGWLGIAAGAVAAMGPSWKHYVNMLRPNTFEEPATVATTPLGDKETEVELYRCYQELVEASESETNVEALDHFRDGWVSLFNTSHRAKIEPPAVANAKTAASKSAVPQA